MHQFNIKRLLGFSGALEEYERVSKIAAINRSQAVIEFALDGTILTANANFLSLLGYRFEEIVGRHHSMFVSPDEKNSNAYRDFWAQLKQGHFQASEYKRLGKDGKEVWIQATYNPMMDKDGRPFKVVKFATDITDQKRKNLDYAGQLTAIGKAQAVIEFKMDGTILNANENFLNVMGYRLGEIQGHHHSMFVDPAYRASADYTAFWARLGRGEYQAAEYKRIGKNGKEVWIQATYNPIFDDTGRPFKVVKFATDVTQTKLQNANFAGQLEAIGKSQAVIEFNLDGTIITANANFLSTLGYTLDEIRGHHHSMFVESSQRQSPEYKMFWERLASGEFQSGEYKRIGKNGREVYIQASYNPIFDMNGRPFKVVKFASDVTAQTIARQRSDLVRLQMENVAAGAEELNVSVGEIASNMVKVKDTADSAVHSVGAAGSTTQKLGDAAEAMVGIVTLIQKITDQVNLLALNATIEAARAGEAGRGFAVVAQEVKNLASQAKSATEQISAEINGVRSVSREVADALIGINDSINAVQQYVASTSAAIEQQSAVAKDMSAQMQRAASEAAALGAS
jgi:methyl-accepting chemotaxis protein